MTAADRRLAAQLSEGSPGVAMEFDLEAAVKLRRDCLTVLERSLDLRGVSKFVCRHFRARQEPGVAFENVLEVFYSSSSRTCLICPVLPR